MVVEAPLACYLQNSVPNYALHLQVMGTIKQEANSMMEPVSYLAYISFQDQLDLFCFNYLAAVFVVTPYSTVPSSFSVVLSIFPRHVHRHFHMDCTRRH